MGSCDQLATARNINLESLKSDGLHHFEVISQQNVEKTRPKSDFFVFIVIQFCCHFVEICLFKNSFCKYLQMPPGPGKNKSGTSLKILWIPGRKKGHDKGAYRPTNHNVEHKHGERKNEVWNLGGSKSHDEILGGG